MQAKGNLLNLSVNVLTKELSERTPKVLFKVIFEWIGFVIKSVKVAQIYFEESIPKILINPLQDFMTRMWRKNPICAKMLNHMGTLVKTNTIVNSLPENVLQNMSP
jgi:hypothetical protein